MRISNARDLGFYVRDRRRDLGLTQARLAGSARVSRRWLTDFEAGKPTAEVGLILNVLHALGLVLHADPADASPSGVLDEVFRNLGTRDAPGQGEGRG